MTPFKNSQITITIIALLAVFLFSNCSVQTSTRRTSTKQLPPGQAKKIYGGKSAKRYAPGQNK